jgi:hypothetical protein
MCAVFLYQVVSTHMNCAADGQRNAILGGAHGDRDGTHVVTRQLGVHLCWARPQDHCLGKPMVSPQLFSPLTKRTSQDVHGKQRDSWGTTAIRVTDLDVTPDQTRVVAVGVLRVETPSLPSTPATTANAAGSSSSKNEFRMVIYDFASKQVET